MEEREFNGIVLERIIDSGELVEHVVVADIKSCPKYTKTQKDTFTLLSEPQDSCHPSPYSKRSLRIKKIAEEGLGTMMDLANIQYKKASRDKEKDINESPNTILSMQRIRRIKKFASMASDIEYFGDEENDNVNRNKINDHYFYRESDVNFSVSQYLETFLYHILYYVVLGPFIWIITLCSKKMRVTFTNMAFELGKKPANYIQLGYWLTTVATIAFYFIGNVKKDKPWWPAIDLILIKAVFIGSVIRTTSIAGKYATYPKMQYRKIKNVLLTQKELNRELMMNLWLQQSQEIKYVELSSSIERLAIDRAALKISFLSSVNQGILKRMEDIKTGRSDSDEMFKTVKHGETQVKYFNAEYVLEIIMDIYNEKLRYIPKLLIGLLIGFSWGFSQLFLRLPFGLPFHGNTALEISIQYLSAIESSTLVMIQYMFYSQAIVDVKRRLFVAAQLTHMISPKAIMSDEGKKFPTINLLDPRSLMAWLGMRRIGQDYGRKYFFRHEIFLPVTLFLALILLICLAGTLYAIRVLKDVEDSLAAELLRLQVSMGIDCLLFFGSAFHFIYCAGKLNDDFSEHIAVIGKNRLIFKDLKLYKSIYFRTFIAADDDEVDTEDPFFGARSKCYLRSKMAKEIIVRHKFNDDKPIEAEIDIFIDGIIEAHDNLLESIKHDSEHAYLTLLGLRVSQATALNGILALTSAIFAFYELIGN